MCFDGRLQQVQQVDVLIHLAQKLLCWLLANGGGLNVCVCVRATDLVKNCFRQFRLHFLRLVRFGTGAVCCTMA